MVFEMIPDCTSIQKDNEYNCKYTGNPCVARTWDGLEGEYDVLDKLMARCPLYSISEWRDESMVELIKNRKLPENIETAISMTDKLD